MVATILKNRMNEIVTRKSNTIVHVICIPFYTGFPQNLQQTLEFQYPTEEDLQSSAETLLRLQDTYGLKTSSMADGRLLEKQSSAPLLGIK